MQKQRPCRTTHRALAGAGLGVACAVLAACETGPLYRPRGLDDLAGYTDRQLTPNRYQVTFTGSVETTRELVEDYLLRRAAEVTLQAGYTHFKFATREIRNEAVAAPHSGHAQISAVDLTLVPRGVGRVPSYWSSFASDDPWNADGMVPAKRFAATSEIVMLNAYEAAKDPDAIAAWDILERLVPSPPPPRA